MKIVIQCASQKKPYAGTFSCGDRKVKFVADPSLNPQPPSYHFFRPDGEKPSTGISWRDFLALYNKSGENSDKLLEASDLYLNPIYSKMMNIVGKQNLYILSAGWGLIRSDYLLPQYDITFSQVKRQDRWKKRKRNDYYNDFNQLEDTCRREPDEAVYFFGGRGYLELLYRLTRHLPGEKTVFFRTPPGGQLDPGVVKKCYKLPNYNYVEYQTPISTNWHYDCAEHFIRQHIQSG